MIRLFTAAAVSFAALALAPDARGSDAAIVLSLDDAFDRVARHHPDLRRGAFAEAGLRAERELAAQSPPLRLGAAVENVGGSGGYQHMEGAEISLTLASVFERGDKRSARAALVDGRLRALDVQREASRLDLLAETARRYLDLVAIDAQLRIAAADVEQRERAAAQAQRRVSVGASPRSIALSAAAAHVRARLDLQRLRTAADAAWRRLAVLWGEVDPGSVPAVAGNALVLPDVPPVQALRHRLDASPALRQFAGEQRVREARLRLATSQRTPDIDWQVGVRRLQGEGDWALLGGMSIPLGSRTRAEPGIRAARAELDALALEREGGELALQSVLIDAHGRYLAARAEVAGYRDELLPAIDAAVSASEAAWWAGAASYLEFAQLQGEQITARRQQLEAALEGQRALIEIQRLIAEPFVLPAPQEGARHD